MFLLTYLFTYLLTYRDGSLQYMRFHSAYGQARGGLRLSP